ncbi:MAG: glycosyltransferase family 39 protein [Phormidesmis sp.]
MTTKRLQPEPLGTRLNVLPHWLPISTILIAATVLFTYRLGSESLWIDELSSIRDADQSLFTVYRTNQLRPLYYLLLSIWMKFGNSEAWLRSLSVIFAVISVFLIYRVGRRIAGEAEGLIAAALLTVSPLFINHAQEVRMYVLSLGLGLAGTLFMVDALLIEPTQRLKQKTLAGWWLFRVLAILTFPLNITLLLPDAIMVLQRFRRERSVLISFTKWAGLLLLFFLPAIAPIASDAAPSSEYAVDRTRYLDPPGLSNLIYPLKYWMVPPQVVRIGPIAHYFYKALTLPIVGLLGAALIQKHKSPALLYMGAWFILPLIPIIGFSRVAAQIWEPRYVLFVSPYLFLLLAAGFTRLWRQWKPAAIIIAAIYTIAMGGALAHYFTVQNRPDYRFNVETIEQYDQPGDAIVWGYEWDDPLRYYYDGGAGIYWQDMHAVTSSEDIRQWVSQFPTGYNRLWVVLDNHNKIAYEVREVIAQDYSIEETYDYAQFSEVMLLIPHSQSAIQSSPLSTASTNP